MAKPISRTEIQAQLADREAIKDCLARYCRGIDRCDPDLLQTVYWPDAIDNHGEFVGSGQDFIEYVMPLLKDMDQTMHMLGNILIDIHDQHANVETYFQAFHRLPDTKAGFKDLVVSGRYVDEFQYRNDHWRIANRLVIIDWFREYEDSADWSSGLLGHPYKMGARKPDDASFQTMYSL